MTTNSTILQNNNPDALKCNSEIFAWIGNKSCNSESYNKCNIYKHGQDYLYYQTDGAYYNASVRGEINNECVGQSPINTMLSKIGSTQESVQQSVFTTSTILTEIGTLIAGCGGALYFASEVTIGLLYGAPMLVIGLIMLGAGLWLNSNEPKNLEEDLNSVTYTNDQIIDESDTVGNIPKFEDFHLD